MRPACVLSSPLLPLPHVGLAVCGVTPFPLCACLLWFVCFQEMLGQGTFGQVVACWSDDFNKTVAVKVRGNVSAYEVE